MSLPGAQTRSHPAPTRTLDDRAPACPRCAYDLSVATQMWSEGQCPTHGRCTECGLEFEWGEVLNPERTVAWWFFETKRGLLGTLWAGLGTTIVALAPWHALRRTPMSLRHRIVRALALPATLLIVWYATGIVAAHLTAVLPTPAPAPHSAQWGWTPVSAASQKPDLTESLLWPFYETPRLATTVSHRHWWPRPIATFLPVVILMHMLACIASFLAIPTTLRAYKVRKVHFVRLFAIGATGVAGVAIALLVVRTALDALEYLDVVGRYWWRVDQFLEWEVVGWAGVAFLVYLAWSLAFWWSACRWYLRLPSPFFHALTLWTLGTMLASAILWVTWDRPADALLELMMWLA